MQLKNVLWILLIIGIYGCRQKSTEIGRELNNMPKIVNLDNKKAVDEMIKLNLDSTYLNLLDPRNVTESEYEGVTKSWSEFHKKIAAHIKKENFKWEIPDSTIKVSNRIYFDKNGKLMYYFFRVLNPSVSPKKQNEYKNLLIKFGAKTNIGLIRENNFAQCGNVKYMNN